MALKFETCPRSRHVILEARKTNSRIDVFRQRDLGQEEGGGGAAQSASSSSSSSSSSNGDGGSGNGGSGSPPPPLIPALAGAPWLDSSGRGSVNFLSGPLPTVGGLAAFPMAAMAPPFLVGVAPPPAGAPGPAAAAAALPAVAKEQQQKPVGAAVALAASAAAGKRSAEQDDAALPLFTAANNTPLPSTDGHCVDILIPAPAAARPSPRAACGGDGDLSEIDLMLLAGVFDEREGGGVEGDGSCFCF